MRKVIPFRNNIHVAIKYFHMQIDLGYCSMNFRQDFR